MAKRRNSTVFLDVSIDGDPAERMIFELFHDIAPNAAENFRALCTGEKGIGPKSGKPLHYKGSFFHRIVSGSLAQGGDFVRRDGTGGESIYGVAFPADAPRIKHDAPGILSMANADRDSNGSHFIVTFKSNHHLDRRCTAFGKIVQGHKLLKKIESVGDEEGVPSVTVKIINSGELNDDKRKTGKVKGVKDVSDDEIKNDSKKGKRKKSSSKKGRKKKRRKYSTSESESSSDTETETSESDTDSLSSDSSFYTSSSSDDRQKRHKKSSKRDKYRHVRKRDKRRDRKRKRHDRRSKRHSKRSFGSDTDVESEEKSGSSSDVNQNGAPRRLQEKTVKCTGEQPLKGGSEVSYVHKKIEEAVVLEGQKGRSPKVNGEQWSGGMGALNNSYGVSDKHDLVNQPMKSRSRSESSRKTMSKSMSISPGRSLSHSPSGTPKDNLSRSPSRSLDKSESSGSPANAVPVRTRRGRSYSKSPSQDDFRKTVSGSRDKSALHGGHSRTPVRISTRKSVSRSPPRGAGKKSVSRSPVRSRRSLSRSSGRPGLRKSPSLSPSRPPPRNNWHGYSTSRGAGGRSRVRSPPSDRGRSVSRSPSSDESPKRIRRGRGFSERYSYARRYRTRSPEYRYGGRYDRGERYSGYRRYSDRSAWAYKSPPRARSPPRYRSRRSRTRSVSGSRSPVRRRGRRFSRSRSPAENSRYRGSPRVERRSVSRSRSRSRSRSSLASQSPVHKASSVERSRSPSGTPPPKKTAGLVSYVDASPASGKRS